MTYLNVFFDKNVVSTVKKIGFYHKVGILLYGKEGTGKSSIMKHYYNRAIAEQNAIVFNVLTANSYLRNVWDFIKQIRTVQNNPIVVIFDEFDEFIKDPSANNEGFLKTILDGNMSIDNCIFMASTNYLERIPEALKNRPSRFKYTVDVEGIQNKESVHKIIKPILSNIFNETEIEVFSDELKGKTLDQIKQFCLDKIMDLETYQSSKKTIGFSGN
jgi:SpoVK/Ycf46/Vps4 family AAA+-type ATPase